ncbi:MAG: DUF1566 domain-containing protein [Candidatus Aminicenantes bacterium]|nr:DUF1566 domain-containing protein [Candidatus Aminicenantes bacterium]
MVGYFVVDTGQETYFDQLNEISKPDNGEPFFGQEANYENLIPSFAANGDGTITDNVTGLMWQKSPDTDGNGVINASDKMTYDEAAAGAGSFDLSGYDDWRLPSIKELYSLIDFRGIDPSGVEGNDTSGLVPFIDEEYFDFGYGDPGAGERIIDAQYASSTLYVGNTANDGGRTLFGVNFADGRIKGYGLTLHNSEKTFYVIYVRGNASYGDNSFSANWDGTITDNATGLMWMQDDSGKGMNWKEALIYAEDLEYAEHSDWRLPNSKELQSLVDYTRSPEKTNSAAIDPVFNCTQIVNEANQVDYPCYWTGTTHINGSQFPGGYGVYVSFGKAMGYMNGNWVDVHGAGAQRSDPKVGDPDEFPYGRGPQGDAIRIYNYVRCVRNIK